MTKAERERLAKEYAKLVHKKHRLEEQIEDKKSKIKNHFDDPKSWEVIGSSKPK